MSDGVKNLLSADDLLPPGFMKKLDRLRMTSRQVRPGASMGERISRARGAGMEFADHKEYSPGDDFRRIDWNVYARLDQFVVRIYETEENLGVTILLDASASMDFPSGPGCVGAKWATAARLAAALGYVALANRDALTIFPFSDKPHRRYDALRGRGHLREMLDLLGANVPGGRSDFSAALRGAGMQVHRPGVCFVISDFCASGNLGEAIEGLVYYGHEVAAVHVVDPLEADPGLEGEVDVEDAETGELIPVTVRGDTARRYGEAFEKRCHAIAAACATYDAKYLRVSTADSVENVVLGPLRREGMVE